ncbi:MAG: hypothetical protein GY839_10840 [candidate division Zixibacteria bacterium]|nr:hypothetical protein [candidate division Zixibacteria bacterium]
MNRRKKRIKSRKQAARLSVKCSQPTHSQQDHLENALRTYATWLVRAAGRKMANNSPDNKPIIDLTSEGNKCSNSLVDNRIRINESNAK